MLDTVLDFISQIAIYAGLFLVFIVVTVLMLSDAVKTWVKTTVFLLAAEGAAAVLGWISWKTFCAGNLTGAVVGCCITLALALFVIYIAVVHHRTNWKKIES